MRIPHPCEDCGHATVACICCGHCGRPPQGCYCGGPAFDAKTCQPGVSYTLGGQTWTLEETWSSPSKHGHDLLFRNKTAPSIVRWVHPDELQHLHSLGLVFSTK